MVTELVPLGFGNVVAMNRVIAILMPNSSPTKRIVQEAKSKGTVVDMTSGRRTKSVLITDTGHVILAATSPDTIVGRLYSLRIKYKEKSPA